MPVWNKDIETLNREDIEQLQLERLQAIVYRCYKNVSFYKNKFDEIGITPDDIQSLDDLSKLPFTTKDDLRESYPYGMFAVPLREIVRIHSSSGATGLPTVVGYTRNDLENWSDLCARIMFAAGVTRDDVVQIAFDYGIFTGGFGFHQGAERIGASVIPTSVGHTNRQVTIIKDYKTTAIASTPNCALTIAERMEKLNIDPKSLNLRVGLFGAEQWNESIRKEVEERLLIKATDNYGLSEILGPGVAGECEERCGLHINEDHFVAEIIDPKTGKKLAAGAEGELVLTTLTKEGFPLLRYRTGDVTTLDIDPCGCGRTLARMARVMKRTDDILIVRGVNVYPSRVREILIQKDGNIPEFQIVAYRQDNKDNLEVKVEISEELFLDEMKQLRTYHLQLERAMQKSLGIAAKVKLVEPATLRDENGSIKRVVDLRPRNGETPPAE
ncbi:MAG TPA: phenylacetate--CoA ligase [bacterium]|mgnify:CR=1 FL=1|nr:phenylacetate--CoA ligase [bacterium]